MGNETTAIATIRDDLEKAMPKFLEVAPKYMKVDRLVRIMLSACSRNPKLLECSRESVLNFCLQCATTGLEPIGAGGAWPIPYRNNKTNKTEMQFMPDYRGLVNCAKRAGCITDAYAEVVKASDEFDYTLGLEPTLTHKPATTDRGELINAYCVFTLPDGTKRFVVMDHDEIEGIRKRSRAGNDGPWKTDVAEMWKKTVVRRAMKPFAGMSAELDAAIDADNAATGLVQREPIAMPTAKVIEVRQEPTGLEQPSRPLGMDPADRGPAIIDEIIEAIETLDNQDKLMSLRRAVGIDDAEDIGMCDETRQKKLLSVIRGELSKRTKTKKAAPSDELNLK